MVEHHLAKVDVVSSNLIARSISFRTPQARGFLLAGRQDMGNLDRGGTAQQSRAKPVCNTVLAMNNLPSPRSLLVGTALTVVILAFTFIYPRLIIGWLGEANPWTSYLYLYGFGLVFFLIGIWVILKSGACKPGRGRDSFWLGVLFAGFILFASLHAVWIVASLNMPYLGGE